jgi:hypothetical protein
MKNEKRKHKRLEMQKPMYIKFMFAGNTTEYTARLLDVSGSGTRLEINLETENTIELSVFTPIVFDLEFEKKVVKCTGQVVRVFSKHQDGKVFYDFGINFKKMSQEDINFINNYVHRGSNNSK